MNGKLMSVSIDDDSSHLAFSAGLFKPLQRHAIFAQIDALVLLKLVGEIIDDSLVEIFAAKKRIAIGRFNFKNAFA